MSQKININNTEYEINKTKTNKHSLKITEYDDDKTCVLSQKIYFFDEIVSFKQECSFGIFTIKIIASNNNKEIILDDINNDGTEESEKMRCFLVKNLIDTL